MQIFCETTNFNTRSTMNMSFCAVLMLLLESRGEKKFNVTKHENDDKKTKRKYNIDHSCLS